MLQRIGTGIVGGVAGVVIGVVIWIASKHNAMDGERILTTLRNLRSRRVHSGVRPGQAKQTTGQSHLTVPFFVPQASSLKPSSYAHHFPNSPSPRTFGHAGNGSQGEGIVARRQEGLRLQRRRARLRHAGPYLRSCDGRHAGRAHALHRCQRHSRIEAGCRRPLTRSGTDWPTRPIRSSFPTAPSIRCTMCSRRFAIRVMKSIIPAPYWVSYAELVKLTGAKPVIVQTRGRKRFQTDARPIQSRDHAANHDSAPLLPQQSDRQRLYAGGTRGAGRHRRRAESIGRQRRNLRPLDLRLAPLRQFSDGSRRACKNARSWSTA